MTRTSEACKNLRTIDLGKYSLNADKVFTDIKFDDYIFDGLSRIHLGEVTGGDWLRFGEMDIIKGKRRSFLRGYAGDEIRDKDCNNCLVVSLALIHVEFLFVEGHNTFFDAVLDTDPNKIMVRTEKWNPGDLTKCEKCTDHQAVANLYKYPKYHRIPDKIKPPVYKFAKLVAGKRIHIQMGTNNDQ